MTIKCFEVIGTPSESVRDVQTADGAVLLDIEQRLCLSMTPVAARVWSLLKQRRQPNEIVDQVAIEFSAPLEQVDEDVRSFLDQLAQRRLLLERRVPRKQKRALNWLCRQILRFHNKPQRTSNRCRRGGRFLFCRALTWLFAFDLLHFRSNFAEMCEFVECWRVIPQISSASSTERVCRAINYACMWYPKRVRCLQRSVVQTCLLRSCGTSAEMVMGAQKFPFKAHAWTEVDGRPINERRDVRSVYLVWERR